MKKLDFSWTDSVLDKVSTLEFLLVEVAVLLVVFVVVHQGSSIVQASVETNAYSSMSTSFTRPSGYVTFKDVGGKTKSYTTSNTSYSTPTYTYWPGSSVEYTVRVGGSSGAILKTGKTTASSTGVAKASWSWSYVAVAYPNIYQDYQKCVIEGGACKIQKFVTNTSPAWATVGQLAPGTFYRLIVCSPDCGTGTKVADVSATTGIPAKLGDPPAMKCNSTGKVDVTFNWTPPSGVSYDMAWIDYSVVDNLPVGIYTQSHSISPLGSTFSGQDFASNQQYYWKINAKIAGTPNAWVTSATSPFKTRDCTTPVVIDCMTADVNRDGKVDSLDYLTITKQINLSYDPKYDMNKDGKIDSADVTLASTKQGVCTPTNYATRLVAKPVCSSLGTGNIVNVDFTWSVATSGGKVEQILDYDIYPHGDVGWPQVKETRFDAGRNTSSLSGFAQNVTYYWRINTNIGGKWYGSAQKSFKTPGCEVLPEPTNLKATVSATSKKADGTICSDVAYGVNFSWTSQGSGWRIDTSVDNIDFATFSSRDVSYRTSLLTTGGDFAPPLTFEPGKFYYWRMYYQVNGRYAVANSPAFGVDYCNVPYLNEFPNGWPTNAGVISQGPNGGSSHGVLEAIDITGGTGTPILATLDGVVFNVCIDGQTCDYGGLGNAVIIKNPKNNNLIIFAHLDSFLIVNGQNVKNRDIIGGMGCTGTCTGTHVHYEFRGLDMDKPYIPSSVPAGCDHESECLVSW